MGISVEWDNDEKTVIRYDFTGPWDWGEFRARTEEVFAMTRSVDHTVDTISNFQAGTTLPKDAIFQFRRAMYNAPPNRGLNVIVGATTYITVLAAIFSRVYKHLGARMVLVDSLEEARATLAERRKQRSDRTARNGPY